MEWNRHTRKTGTDIQILTMGGTDRQILRDRHINTEGPINRHYKYILSVSLYVLFVRIIFDMSQFVYLYAIYISINHGPFVHIGCLRWVHVGHYMNSD